MVKKRNRNAKQGRAGVIAVEDACNRLDLIWRNLLEEDVGVDGTIEIALGDFPTGKIVGAQVKSGLSWIRAETQTSFRFYPTQDDVDYWRSLSIPLYILIHHPGDKCVYWVDFSGHVESDIGGPGAERYITFTKANKVDADFEAHLRGRFDLETYTDQQFADLRRELELLTHIDGSGRGEARITGLDLFIEGLWGLCSKLQFHSSLVADLIRAQVSQRGGTVPITYTFDRATLYPFFTRYFRLLREHRLATVDLGDISESLYVKLEYPTFISPLTTNGRRFVEYLRRDGVPRVRDNQFMSLSVRPHVQIDIYSTFDVLGDQPKFGPFTDVLAIGFNAYLDYYHITHWRRTDLDEPVREMASQNIHYFALIEYLVSVFAKVDKDHVLLRHRDIPLSPLICWLEAWYAHPEGMPTVELRGKSAKELAGFSDELMAILGPIGVATVKEPPDLPFPDPFLLSGEVFKPLANARLSPEKA